jgi:DNA-directed RNA polymerase subunit RPC12/RpoP
MYMNIICPLCGDKCRVPERALGQKMACPACGQTFVCSLPPAPQPPTEASPLVTESQSPANVAEGGIHYRCPRCQRSLRSPTNAAGQKVSCPNCGQRLQVPQSSVPNPTLVASGQPAPTTVPVSVVPRQPAPPPPPTPIPTVVPIVERPVSPTPPVRRESCLECGLDLSRRERILTCPDCGSLFCSAGCFRDHRFYAHSGR